MATSSLNLFLIFEEYQVQFSYKILIFKEEQCINYKRVINIYKRIYNKNAKTIFCICLKLSRKEAEQKLMFWKPIG